MTKKEIAKVNHIFKISAILKYDKRLFVLENLDYLNDKIKKNTMTVIRECRELGLNHNLVI